MTWRDSEAMAQRVWVPEGCGEVWGGGEQEARMTLGFQSR